MPSTDRSPSHAASSLSAVVALALGVAAARVIYLVWFCPYDLVEDEAQYWLWAENLSWSYYSKGPGIAWAIALATSLAGDAEWAIRLVATFSGLVSTLCVGGLARDLARACAHPRPARVALWAAFVWTIAPFVQMSSILSTIDGPLLACWALAAWMGWRAAALGSRSALLALGLAVGVGFLFKYTMLLIVPGVILGAWSVGRVARAGREESASHDAREHTRTRLSTPWLVAGALLALLALAPVIIWNAQHGWVTIKHLLGHLGVAGGDVSVAADNSGGRKWFEWLPVWPIGLALMQVGLAGPMLIVGAAVGWKALARQSIPGTAEQPSLNAFPRATAARYLALVALPLVVFYAIVAYVAEPEGNWPIAACVTLLPLATLWWLGVFDTPERRPASRSRTRWGRRLCGAGIIYGVLAAPLLHRADVAARLVNNTLAYEPVWNLVSRIRGGTKNGPQPITLGRLIGGRAMGDEVTRVLSDLQSRTGQRPFVLSQHYGRASLMAYYVAWPQHDGADGGDAGGTGNAGGIESYCSGTITGGRMSHFDFMDTTDLADPRLIGRPAVILSNDRPDVRQTWERLFEHVSAAPDSSATRNGRLKSERKRDRVVYIATGFRGIAPPAAPTRTSEQSRRP